MATATLLSMNIASANPGEWLQCTTVGDALEVASIAVNSMPEDSDTVLLAVTQLSGETQQYNAELENGATAKMAKKGRVDILFKSEESIEFGGATTDAALLVLKGDKKGLIKRILHPRDRGITEFNGNLAINGIVYGLHCVNPN